MFLLSLPIQLTCCPRYVIDIGHAPRIAKPCAQPARGADLFNILLTSAKLPCTGIASSSDRMRLRNDLFYDDFLYFAFFPFFAILKSFQEIRLLQPLSE